jgi:hypothetical protein
MEDVMQFGQVINATPHPLRIYDAEGKRIVLVLPVSEIIIRAGERLVTLSDADVNGIEIPVYGAAYGSPNAVDHDDHPVAVPEPREGVFYVVALPPALAASTRTDFLVCGPAVRDPEGRMIGCMGLTVPHHPIAAQDEPRDLGKIGVGELLERHTGKDSYWEDTSPSALFREAFRLGLISREEMDLAHERRYPGQDWYYAGT